MNAALAKNAFLLGFMVLSVTSKADLLPTQPAAPLEYEPFSITFDFSTRYMCKLLDPASVYDQSPRESILLGTNCVLGASPTTLHETVVMPGLPVGVHTVYASLWIGTGFEPPPEIDTLVGTISITRDASETRETVVEYYDYVTNHYFLTPLQNEIEVLDARRHPFEDWQRTGKTFKAIIPGKILGDQKTVAICRFYNDSFVSSSHFYAAKGFGCEQTLASFPDWKLETSQLFDAFPVATADGSCETGSIPLYRYYNNGQGGAPNHRYTVDVADRDVMLKQGWIPEGYGIGIAMCVPQ